MSPFPIPGWLIWMERGMTEEQQAREVLGVVKILVGLPVAEEILEEGPLAVGVGVQREE